MRHVIANDYLFLSAGRLAMGERAEKVYGRKNFMELYAVFSSPAFYTVVAAIGKELGELDQHFVDRLQEERSSSLLAGRAWIVDEINHKEKRIRVAPAPKGQKPSWGGFLPQFRGFEVCRKIRAILRDAKDYPYLHESAREFFEAHRAELRLLEGSGDALFFEQGEARWWTFAGGRVNMTLKLALESLGPWKVSTGNFRLIAQGDSPLQDEFRAALERLRQDSFWTDEETWDRLATRLPPFRLSKFQHALPDWAQREMLRAFFLDPDQAGNFLKSGVTTKPKIKPRNR